MSIMKDKPYYCESFFTVPDINLFKDNKVALDIGAFIEVDKFFKAWGSKLADSYVLAPVKSNNGRTYGTEIWGRFDPFHHPRYKLFQADNELLTRLLI